MKNSLQKYFLFIGFHFLFFTLLFSQQEVQYSMYRFNGLYINPAYAGSHEVLNTMAIFRQQWVKIPGAPMSASVAAHSPLKNEKIALGLIYNFDKIGVIQTNDANISFAYRFPIGKQKNVRLCFGISAGVSYFSNNLNSVATTEPDDPNFSNNNIYLWLPNVGAGIYAYSDNFFAGISVPKLLTSGLTKKYSIYETAPNVARQYYHLLVTGGYVFTLDKKLKRVKFVPSVLLKYSPAHSPVTFDLNANFIFIDRIWIGVSYRYNDSFGFMLAGNVTQQLRIGYAYDLSTSKLSSFTSGSHEVMASFDFNFIHKKIVSPRQIKYF